MPDRLADADARAGDDLGPGLPRAQFEGRAVEREKV